MKRRNFVRNSFLVAGGFVVSTKLVAQTSSEKTKKVSRLTILHTNDTHSNIDPFPANHSKYPNMGGVSKRYSLINKIREEEEHVILLVAGDIFKEHLISINTAVCWK